MDPEDRGVSRRGGSPQGELLKGGPGVDEISSWGSVVGKAI